MSLPAAEPLTELLVPPPPPPAAALGSAEEEKEAPLPKEVSVVIVATEGERGPVNVGIGLIAVSKAKQRITYAFLSRKVLRGTARRAFAKRPRSAGLGATAECAATRVGPATHVHLEMTYA